VTDAEHGDVIAGTHFTPFADGDLLERGLPLGHHALATWVADAERAAVAQLCGVHQVAQFLLVHRRAHDHVRDAAEVRDVEGAVVRGSIGTGQSAAIQAEDHMQVLQGHIMHHLIVGALHERAVDVAERHHALGGHARGEGDRVLFGDAHVEGAVRHGLHHDVERGAAWASPA
jgi:hypothetical protein